MIRPIVTYPLNGIDYEAEDAETYLATRSSGVFSGENNMDISITGTWQVTIGTGLAWLNNEKLKGKSVCINEPIPLDLEHLTTPGLHKYARVLLHFDKTTNDTTLIVRYGGNPVASNSTPTLPDVVRNEDVYELSLYRIDISGDTTELRASHILDERMDESVCGLMRDGVERIPTDVLREQFLSQASRFQMELSGNYTAWFNEIRNIFTGTSDQVIQRIVNGIDAIGEPVSRQQIDGMNWGE